MNQHKLTSFKKDISGISLPIKFTFPFFYVPHELAKIASEEIQDYLLGPNDINHDFGLGEKVNSESLGKMFGVLVVKNSAGDVGYISAFSGKLGNSNLYEKFVPPVFDMLEVDSHFMNESKVLDELNKEILRLEADSKLEEALRKLNEKQEENAEKVIVQRDDLKKYQKARQALRVKQEALLSIENFQILREQHNQESINDTFLLREYSIYLNEQLEPFRIKYQSLQDEIDALKRELSAKSVELQKWLFAQYNFLSAEGEEKNVIEIFNSKIPDVPPSGAGDCAAPKLLQYAYLNGLTPIAMAEFWWGRPPNSNSRKHGYYYPSCRGKCEPILGHMLRGLDVDDNPLMENPAFGKTIDTVYEDTHLLIINKPAEFMSVPGKLVTDSVQERLKEKYPESTGPMIVHRLDMSTSGLMVVAKSKEVHKALQEQFKSRKVKKRYLAVLNGEVKDDSGYINLPLRVDLENRPFQIVCNEYGKSARTKYQVISRKEGKTRIHFYPITGRTHQLRVHASHHLGLNAPIVGDDLYGLRDERLHLHAEKIEFVHPVSKARAVFEVAAEF